MDMEYDSANLLSTTLYVRRRFGIEVFRDTRRFCAVLSDLAPSLERDITHLHNLGKAGFFQRMFEAESQEEKKNLAAKAYSWFVQWGLESALAGYYVNILGALFDADSGEMKSYRTAPVRSGEDMPPPRNPCPLYVFYVLDTSVDMAGEPIEILNSLEMKTLSNILREAKREEKYCLLRLAALEFNSVCRWFPLDGPCTVSQYESCYRAASLSPPNMAAALKELGKRLTRNEWLKEWEPAEGAVYPLIIFISRGKFQSRFAAELDELKKNQYFHRALKVAFCLGTTDEKRALAAITGNRKLVLDSADFEAGEFRRLLRRHYGNP